MTAAVAFLMFALIGAGFLAVWCALNAKADDLLAEWDDAEAAHDEMSRPW